MSTASTRDQGSSVLVRRACEKDLAAIAEVHIAAFPGFVLTRLGAGFLRGYYRAVLDYDAGILLVAVAEDRVIGFAAGFCHPEGFLKHLKRRTLALAPQIALGILRSPGILSIVFQNARGVFSGRGVGPQHNPGETELCSLGVLPSRQGMGVGRQLSTAFIEAARADGASGVYLYTDAVGNHPVNAFYQSVGFTVRTTYTASGGRLRHEYYLPLT